MYSIDLLPQCDNFLLHKLNSFRGNYLRKYGIWLVIFVTELEECILQPIRSLFNSKLSCIHQLLILNYLGRLAQHWAVMEYERFKNCLSGPFPMTNANIEEGPLDSIFGLSEAITQMAETGFCQLVSKGENSDRHRLHVNTYIQETLSIFRTVCIFFARCPLAEPAELPETQKLVYFFCICPLVSFLELVTRWKIFWIL